MSDFPQSWAITPLITVLESLRDGTHTPPKRTSEGVPLLSARNVQNGTIDWSEAYSHIAAEDYLQIQRTNPVSEGDVLLTIVGSIGRSCVNRTSDQFTLQRSVAIAKPDRRVVDADYLSLLFRSQGFQAALEEFASGTAQRGVYLGALKTIPIALAPLNEQRRIVAKLEKLLCRVNAAQERLATIPRILKRFRQAILAAAYSGSLIGDLKTGEWPHVLLDEISRELITGPFGSALHKSDYVQAGVPVINPINIVNGKILPSQNMAVSRSTMNRLSRYVLENRDIVLARRGELGRCALVRATEVGWLCGTGSAILRVDPKRALPEYIQIVISSPNARSYLNDGAVGTTMANLNQRLFLAMPLLLPSLDEQQETVRRVEVLFNTADALEARYHKAKAHVDKLTQSILAKAFHGELVAQDANDEPASVLIERIHKSRDGIGVKKKKVGTRVT